MIGAGVVFAFGLPPALLRVVDVLVALRAGLTVAPMHSNRSNNNCLIFGIIAVELDRHKPRTAVRYSYGWSDEQLTNICELVTHRTTIQ